MKSEIEPNITFCFPDPNTVTDKKNLVNEICRKIKSGPEIGFAGFQKKADFSNYLAGRIFDGPNYEYKSISATEMNKIEVTIISMTKKCIDNIWTDGLHVFVFPWLGVKYDEAFGGINGFAPYANTIHIFISPEKHSDQALKETVTHEFNHAIYLLKRNLASELTLLETLVFEGLAENFREEIVGGKASPWSNALSESESKLELEALRNSLNFIDRDLYEQVFFGSDKYKKWTGYSIGYKVVKSFRLTYPQTTWEEIMKMKAGAIFEKSPFVKKGV